MVDYVVMDYDGEPVIIEDGEMCDVEPDEGEHWNPDTLELEPDDDEDDYENYDDEPDWDRIPYGWSGYCYPRRRGAWEEEREFFIKYCV